MELSPKDPDVDTWYELDWLEQLVPPWRPGRDYAISEFVRPRRPTGFYPQASKAGMSAAEEPDWLYTAGLERIDGSVIWVMRDPVSVTVPPISVSVWVSAGATVAGNAIDGRHTRVLFSGGSVGVPIIAVNTVTVAGLEYDQTLVVPVEHT